MNISNIQPASLLNITKPQATTETESSTSFGTLLNQYINETDAAVKDLDAKSLSLAKGEPINLHDVTIAAQKATIAVTLTTQVRDKAVEAYQEMMRMQV